MALTCSAGPNVDFCGRKKRWTAKYTFTSVTSGTLTVPFTSIENYNIEAYSGTAPSESISGTTFTFSGASSGAVIYIEVIGKP